MTPEAPFQTGPKGACGIATLVFRAMKVPEGVDVTKDDEFFADEGDPRLHDLPQVVH